jgi:ketohexokinase
VPAPRAGQILGVGIATLDLVNEVAAYPEEDSETRALAQRRARGGNAANTLAVLAQLGRRCAWVGTLADDPDAGFIRADLAERGIRCDQAVQIPRTTTPTSYIVLSRANGSRTIVHHRDLPELSAADFARVPLAGLDWVHFEGRNPPETARMLERTRREAPAASISVELEKPRPGIESLLGAADLLLIGRQFALAQAGYGADPAALLRGLAGRTGARMLVLGWGAEGAWLLVSGDEPRLIPAVPPARVVDTLGAGDVLNAGVIDGLIRGMTPDQALAGAVRLAGIKCGRMGLDGLAEAARGSGPQ